MIRFTVVILMCSAVLGSKGSEDVFIKSHLSIAPTLRIGQAKHPLFLNGNLTCYVSSATSLLGDAYFNIRKDKNESVQDHTLLFGAALHPFTGSHDLFFALQPGFSIRHERNSELPSTASISPASAFSVGYNFYFHRYMHFFINGKCIAQSLNQEKVVFDVRTSAGLGFHLHKIWKRS